MSINFSSQAGPVGLQHSIAGTSSNSGTAGLKGRIFSAEKMSGTPYFATAQATLSEKTRFVPQEDFSGLARLSLSAV